MGDANKNAKILSTKSAIIYGIGIMGVQLLIGYVNGFQTEFYNKMYSSFDSNIFYAAAIIILAGKLISCFADPIIGTIIDRSHLKGGKMRPWVLYSAFPIAVFTTMMFIYIPFSNLGQTIGKIVMYIYITITTVFWNVAMTFADIPSQGMLSLLTPNENERNGAAGISNTLRSVGLGIPSLFVTLVMLVMSAIKERDDTDPEYIRKYFLITALVICVLGTALYLLIYFCNREKVQSVANKTVTMKEMFKELKHNKLIFIVFISYILGSTRTIGLAVALQTGGAIVGKVYIPVLSEVFAGGGLLDPTSNAGWILGVTSAVTCMLSVVAAPFINKKWGEKKTFLVFAIYGFIVCMIFFIFYVCLPEGHTLRTGLPALIMIWVMNVFAGLLFGPHGYLPMVMTADIIDYTEWKTGERKEGVDFAILSMSFKLSHAFGVASGIFFVAISGYTHAAFVAGEITVKMQNILFFSYMALQGIGCLLSMIPVFWYKIDFKVKKQMQTALAVRRKLRAEGADEETIAQAEAEALAALEQ
ncbi:MAG: MFS transporter [Clostridia bacterium]|nr:MFS transporter [Clostridia bacterium]